MRTDKLNTARNEEGFVLILALVILLLLTLLGAWALNSADFETRVAGNAQQADRVFNLNEGANYAEASKVVHCRRTWLDPGNRYRTYTPLLPNEEGEFDPFSKMGALKARAEADRHLSDARELTEGDKPEILQSTDYWLWDNLEGAYDSKPGHPSDYRYMVTYMMCDDIVEQGSDSSTAAELHTNKYRVQAAGAAQNGVVETAVTVMGPGGCN